MHATLRRIRTKPGQVAEVARLIESQYVPKIEGVPGFVSYTLADLGDDEIFSVGVFSDEASAAQANEVARSWTAEVLSGYVASPLDAADGTVLVDHRG